MSVTLVISSTRNVRLLREIIEVYMTRGGPAVECVPDWDPLETGETYTAAEVEQLGAELVAALQE